MHILQTLKFFFQRFLLTSLQSNMLKFYNIDSCITSPAAPEPRKDSEEDPNDNNIIPELSDEPPERLKPTIEIVTDLPMKEFTYAWKINNFRVAVNEMKSPVQFKVKVEHATGGVKSEWAFELVRESVFETHWLYGTWITTPMGRIQRTLTSVNGKDPLKNNCSSGETSLDIEIRDRNNNIFYRSTGARWKTTQFWTSLTECPGFKWSDIPVLEDDSVVINLKFCVFSALTQTEKDIITEQ